MTFKIKYKRWPPRDGSLEYGRVPWDSELFGFPVFDLQLPDTDSTEVPGLGDLLSHLSQSTSTCLAVAKLPVHAVSLASIFVAHKFYPVESQIEPYLNLKNFRWDRRFPGLHLRNAEMKELSQLAEVAEQAFSKDRFHLDPNLCSTVAGLRYRRWLEEGLRSGDIVLTFEDPGRGEILGFCHLRDIGDGAVDFSLGAVTPTMQKAGIGLLMYANCLEKCRDRGFTRMVTRVSLANVGVLNIFSTLGCLFRNATMTLHWFHRVNEEDDSVGATLPET